MNENGKMGIPFMSEEEIKMNCELSYCGNNI
jgi:hypothetical protein